MAEEAPSGAPLAVADIFEQWPSMDAAARAKAYRLLHRGEAELLVFALEPREQAELFLAMPPGERRSWIRLLPPDDCADLVQAAPHEVRDELLGLLDEQTRKEVTALLAYAEDEAGGLMNTRYTRARPDMSVDEAITYLRRQARDKVETIYYTYVLDADQKLMGVVSFRDLFTAPPDKKVRDVMSKTVIAVREETDQEEVAKLYRKHELLAIPVVDAEGRMKGIITVDDIIDVVLDEATEDIQKFGGVGALEQPYLEAPLLEVLKKRGGWLAVLFLGEMLTASAMTYFEHAIARAVVLALFVPLIISSGGNSGSQASTLVIRALALEQIRLGDWWRIMRRELVAGLTLGVLLAAIGFARIALWQAIFHLYGPYWVFVASTVAISLVGVVMWGSLAGSLLPLVLRRLGFDPASASAPFVATLVDVSGLIIYFSAATVIMRGTLL